MNSCGISDSILILYTFGLAILLRTITLRWLLVRARDARAYLESVYRMRTENLMKEVKEELPEGYILFLKVKNHYVKIGASETTTYTRLTKLRTACWFARRLCYSVSLLRSLLRMSGRYFHQRST